MKTEIKNPFNTPSGGRKPQYPNIAKAGSRLIFFAVLAALVFGVFGGCMTSRIGAGEAGVKFSTLSGTKIDQQYDEGLHFHPPWVNVISYDVKVQEQLEQLEALSSDGLNIAMEVSVLYRADKATIPELHSNLGQDYYRKLIQPVLRSVSREVVGQYTPEELYSSKRTELQAQIEEGVRLRTDGANVFLDDVLIRDVQLPQQIRSAIEKKLQEEQDAERYEFTIEKEKLEAERKAIEAEGEANYQRIITESLSSQFLRFKGIEATRELAQSPNSKVVVVGSGKDGLPIILGDN